MYKYVSSAKAESASPNSAEMRRTKGAVDFHFHLRNNGHLLPVFRRSLLKLCVVAVTIYGLWKIVHDLTQLKQGGYSTMATFYQMVYLERSEFAANAQYEVPSSTVSIVTNAPAAIASATPTPTSAQIRLTKLRDLAAFWTDPPVCELLRQGDNYTTVACANHTNVTELSAQHYLDSTCHSIRSRGYLLDDSIVSDDERSFPIGMSILMYSNVWQFERLLRAVYRAQNTYCIHVDLNANNLTFEAVRKISSCFDNVRVTTERYAIQWGTISVIDAELSCMRVLRDASASWRYFINLTGQEHPLRTMWEVVRAARSMNGLNSIDSGCPPHPSFEYRLVNMRHFAGKFGVEPCVGSTHIIVVRGFVEHLLENPLAKMLHSALLNDQVPDETFFGTLDHNAHLGLPGARDFRNPPPMDFHPSWNRLKNWVGLYPCNGKYVRKICIWGVGDLPFLTNSSRRELFTNKLHWDFQHYTLDCLESWYWNRTISELQAHWLSLPGADDRSPA